MNASFIDKSSVTICIILVIVIITLNWQRFNEFFNKNISHVTLKPKSPRDMRYKQCKDVDLTNPEQKALKERDLIKTSDGDSYKFWYPCGYDNSDNEIRNQLGKWSQFNNETIVMGIQGQDYLASKESIWNLLESKYGRIRSQIFMPETWVLYNNDHLRLLETKVRNNPRKNKLILKKNTQRQTGLLITDDISYIVSGSAFKDGYVVAQEILDDPLVINKRKVSIRVYCLYVCKEDRRGFFIWNNGFLYYSPMEYNNDTSTHKDAVITSGYVSRELYSDNPLSLQDLKDYIIDNQGETTWENFWKNITYILQEVIDSAHDYLCTASTSTPMIKYGQLFGVDIQPNKDLSDVKLLEFNKGPSMAIMDTKDGEIKISLQRDLLELMENGTLGGFEKIY